MAQYTLLNRDALVTILRHYTLGELDQFTPLDGGQANSSTIISTDTGKYVISVCDEKSFTELDLLTRTLEHLADYHITTTRLVKTNTNQSSIEYEGKPVYIKEYIEGSVPNQLQPGMTHQIGLALAKLHEVPPLIDLPTHFPYGIEFFAELRSESGEFPRWLDEKTTCLQHYITPDLPRGLIHGDLFYDNTVFLNSKLAALLDFEEVCHYYLIFDLGMCCAGCCCPEGTLSVPLTTALVEGYQSVRQLSPLEREVFKYHIEYGAIATAFWRYRQYNIIIPDIGKNETYREMSDLADSIAGIADDEFSKTIFTG